MQFFTALHSSHPFIPKLQYHQTTNLHIKSEVNAQYSFLIIVIYNDMGSDIYHSQYNKSGKPIACIYTLKSFSVCRKALSGIRFIDIFFPEGSGKNRGRLCLHLVKLAVGQKSLTPGQGNCQLLLLFANIFVLYMLFGHVKCQLDN